MPAPGTLTGDSLANFTEFFSVLTPYIEAVGKSKAKKLSRQWLEGYQAILDAYLGKGPERFVYEGREYTPKSFAGSLGLDFDDYFYHIVGVSLNPESEPQRVMLKATYPAVWYIETKPLHRSQKIMVEAKAYKVFELEIIPNEEFVQQLLVYADQVEVLEPKSLRENLRDRGEKIADRNKKVAMT